jgi:hypothetical protein
VLGAGSHSIVHSFPHRGSTRPSTASVAAGDWQAIRLLQAILISLWRSRCARMGNAPITTVTTSDKDRDIATFDAGGAACIEQQTTGPRQSRPWTPPSPPAFAFFCPPHTVMILDCLPLPTIATSGPILLASPCVSVRLHLPAKTAGFPAPIRARAGLGLLSPQLPPRASRQASTGLRARDVRSIRSDREMEFALHACGLIPNHPRVGLLGPEVHRGNRRR